MSELRTPSRNDHARAPPIAVTIATTTNTTATTMTSATIFDMMIPALSRQCVTKPPSTPSSSGSGMDMCGVCLSPLKSCSSIVETRCKHKFHDKCLLKVKERKAECPSCRHPLTPLTAAESTELLGFSLDESPIPSRRPPPRELQRWLPSQTTFHQPTSSRSADIVLAATRGRNAVRYVLIVADDCTVILARVQLDEGIY